MPQKITKLTVAPNTVGVKAQTENRLTASEELWCFKFYNSIIVSFILQALTRSLRQFMALALTRGCSFVAFQTINKGPQSLVETGRSVKAKRKTFFPIRLHLISHKL